MSTASAHLHSHDSAAVAVFVLRVSRYRQTCRHCTAAPSPASHSHRVAPLPAFAQRSSSMSTAPSVLSPLSNPPLSLPEQEFVEREDSSPTRQQNNAESNHTKQTARSAQPSKPAVFSFAPPTMPPSRFASNGSDSSAEDEGFSRRTTPELEDFCLWLARLPVEYNHPRPLKLPHTPNGAAAAGSVLTVRETDGIAVVFDRLVSEGLQKLATEGFLTLMNAVSALTMP